MLRGLGIALTLLTRLPVRLSRAPTPAEQGLSVMAYPLVGLLIGLLLCALALPLQWLDAPPLLAAVMIVVLWVAVTGALHLDGLADSADAWLGAHGDPDRALAIMKDPACGPAGIIALVLVLLLKVAALSALLASTRSLWWLLAAPVLGRSACAALFLLADYARSTGLAADAVKHLRPGPTWFALIALAVAVSLPGGRGGFLGLAIAVLTFYLAYRWMQAMIRGFTGDTAGATVEVVEATTLLAIALFVGMG
ncbi:adenosylcobinamide-GDP ribazoletransferase [Natronocella acetinitrilica]|uniref:Adenosylcobinamide-GDP ribazoletransferase n=1 Tax=Natronocella acetinitrilica TaxID=414046 RepID=A0AAE3KB77_9GAMM|nr:adenosylcobinamide-GDP ribazoletransferase [Natronocella acetinitrilica]MCP1673263.1 adenosylcobinamide-GDP ribazoletransferase [Natronocella acetinitrilica]